MPTNDPTTMTDEEDTRANVVCAQILTAIHSEPDEAIAALGVVRALSRHYGQSETRFGILVVIAESACIRAEMLLLYGGDELAIPRALRAIDPSLSPKWE